MIPALLLRAGRHRRRSGKSTTSSFPLLAQESGISVEDALKETNFLAVRSDVLALAFPDRQDRDEMFVAFTAQKSIAHIIWVARGKPKSQRQNEIVVSEFTRAIKKALQVEYTDDELRQLFEIALHRL